MDERLSKLREKWSAFLERWPVERIERMTLEEYAAGGGRRDTLCYDLEWNSLGAIGGGSAYKFGIYRITNAFKEKRGYRTDGTYGWSAKYGDTAKEVVSL